jgi:CheY-like chemotaxis protein
MRVLVVDDSHDSRQMYTDCLRDAGWELEAVADGDEALAIAASFAPNVIVMDLAMPGVDGLEATRRLKKDARTSHVPIVALTAYASRAHEALAAGCAEFLTKPCGAQDLVAVLEQVARVASDSDRDD